MVYVSKLMTQNRFTPLKPRSSEPLTSTYKRDHLDTQKVLSDRASRPVGDDPLQMFTSSMTDDEITIQFMQLIQKAQQAVAA